MTDPRGQAADPDGCAHHWVSQHRPVHVLYWVRQCTLCHEVDWDDLDRQIKGLLAIAKSHPDPAIAAAIAAAVAAEVRAEIAVMADEENATCTDSEGAVVPFSAFLRAQEGDGNG